MKFAQQAQPLSWDNMSNTKDEIEIKITKKDRIYLSIILAIVCIAAVVCILVPRHYILQERNSSNQTNPPAASGSPTTPTIPSTPSEPEEPTNPDDEFIDTYSNKSLKIIVEAGGGYALFAKYQNSEGNIDASKINLSSVNINELESIAQPLYEMFQTHISGGQAITESFINSNNELFNSITAFTNKLNSFAEA